MIALMDGQSRLSQQRSLKMNIIRELSDAELDFASGGKVYTSRVGGFTFKYDDKTDETTVGAGGIEVTTNPGSDPNNGRCASIMVTGMPM
jgi:hypothetical protein